MAELFDLVAARMLELDRRAIPGFVACDLATVHGALERIVDDGLARGPVFCEWGSGLGAASALAALHAFEAYGIEIEADLVTAARQLAVDIDVEVTYAEGTFLLPGDEALLTDTRYAHSEVGCGAYDELGLTPEDCDVVFTYPWPGDEQLADELFLRHSTPGALLMTFHDTDRLLVQRHVAGLDELQPLGWM